jgi:hypothetical protein
MSVVRVLLRLHPAPFRERWGPELEADAQAAGARSWPNLVANALDMWLHPVIWPADSASQRQHRAATTALAITLAAWFTGRAATANDSQVTWQAHPVWNVADCAMLMLLGAALVLPLPRPTPNAVAALLRKSVTSLAAPAALGIGALIFVHTTHPATGSTARLLVTASYWLTLGLAAIQVGRIIGTTGTAVLSPPSPERLRLGIGILTVGSALSSWITLSSLAAGDGVDGVSATAGGCLLALTCMLFSILRDLHDS